MRTISVFILQLAMLCLAGCERPASSAAAGPAPQRPQLALSSEESFDPGAIAAYAGDHQAVYEHIDSEIERHVAELQRWLQQRSISAQNDGIAEMAELVRGDFEALGFAEAELVPTDGHPGVWGYYDAGAERTLMVYMMYDVQPVDPEDWRVPPFAGALVETDLGTVLMARGATNQKGPERAFLNALSSIIAVDGGLPVNLMITAEGEEEIGSVHYPQIVDRYAKRLAEADGVFFPFNSLGRDGQASMSLGVKGIIYFELESTGGAWGGPSRHEVHGSLKSLVDSPVWRLVHALDSLTSEDGNTILVPGYYDDVRGPTEEESRLINRMLVTFDEAQFKQALGVERWIDDLSGAEAIVEYLYMPTLNIDGIWGGYTEEGSKTILPHRATAKVDSRLPPNLDPDKALALIRRHLDAQGYTDVVLRSLDAGYPAAQTSLNSSWVQTAIGIFNKYGRTPSVSPRLAGSAPFYQFSGRLDLPLVFAGMGHGTGAHAPDEYMLIEPKDPDGPGGLAAAEKFYVDLMYAFAELPAGAR